MALQVVPAEAEAQEEADLDGEELDGENTLEAPDSQSEEEIEPLQSKIIKGTRKKRPKQTTLQATRTIKKKERVQPKIRKNWDKAVYLSPKFTKMLQNWYALYTYLVLNPESDELNQLPLLDELFKNTKMKFEFRGVQARIESLLKLFLSSKGTVLLRRALPGGFTGRVMCNFSPFAESTKSR